MEVVEEIQTHQGCKFPRRIGNGNENGDEQYPDEEEDVEVKRRSSAAGGGGGGGRDGGIDFARLCGWPSSRIVRVSRASGGKDRHSKVLTSKGLRDRRVRLSVNTAIQFYDLQDRLGVDQPSKAVEWLLKAAASSISELPSIDTSSFPASPKLKLSNERRLSDGLDSADVELDGSLDLVQQQQQNGVLSKSACSSPSETSKGSGLSLSRSESRIKARERARGRAVEKEKDKESENNHLVQLHHHHNHNHDYDHDHDQHKHNLNPISQNASSFTELLTSGMNNGNNNSTNGTNHQNHSRSGGGGGGGGDVGGRHWSSAPMDYFATGLLGPASTRTTHGFSGQIHFGEQYQELQSFPCVPEQFVPLVNGGNNGNNNNNAYDLNFTISSSTTSGLAGFNRGTLQSNSSTPSLLPQIQRFSSIDGSSPTFLIGSNAPVENNHHFLPGYDARLQLYYGDGRHSDHKGKEKN